jgi:hypothetical protein
MKKVFALLLVLVMVIGLCACGDKGGKTPSGNSVAGRYYLVSMAEGDMTISIEEYSEMLGYDVEMYIDVRADGTATAKNMDGEYMEMAWGNGQMWPVDEPEEKANCTFSGDTMTVGMDGEKMVFKKGAPAKDSDEDVAFDDYDVDFDYDADLGDLDDYDVDFDYDADLGDYDVDFDDADLEDALSELEDALSQLEDIDFDDFG